MSSDPQYSEDGYPVGAHLLETVGEEDDDDLSGDGKKKNGGAAGEGDDGFGGKGKSKSRTRDHDGTGCFAFDSSIIRTILVVEKDTIFRKLLEHRVPQQYRLCLVT